MATRRQKGKDRKRAKAWHRGEGEARRWRAADLPAVASGADPTTGAPTRLRRNGHGHPRRNHP